MTPPELLALGFFLGMRHATDADHLVAVTTIVCRERAARSAIAIGAFGGVGHTVTILLVGDAIVYSCVVDGAAAATGASLGKLNLALTEAPPDQTRTTYRRRSTGQTITLRVAERFAARFLNVPRANLAEEGRQVLRLSDREVFEVVP